MRLKVAFLASDLVETKPIQAQFAVLGWQVEQFSKVQSLARTVSHDFFQVLCIDRLDMESINCLSSAMPSPDVLKEMCVCFNNIDMQAMKYMDDRNIKMVKYDLRPQKPDQLIRSIRSKCPKYVRVVVADDLPMVRLQISTLIAEFGFMVVGQAADGVEAVNQCTELKPDLLTLDINMPNKNGLQTFHELSKLSPGTQIVMVTGQRTKEFVVAAAQLGVKHFVGKPITKQNITDVIIKALF
ncbi:MAG: response regulator [bacterium]